MTAVIRQYTSDDAWLIRSLGMTTFRDTFAADNSRENMEDYLRHSFSPELVKSQLSEPESVFMLASVGGIPQPTCSSTLGRPRRSSSVILPWRSSGYTFYRTSNARDWAPCWSIRPSNEPGTGI